MDMNPFVKEILACEKLTAEIAKKILHDVINIERKECAELCQGIANSSQFDGWQQYAAAACRDAINARTTKGKLKTGYQ